MLPGGRSPKGVDFAGVNATSPHEPAHRHRDRDDHNDPSRNLGKFDHMHPSAQRLSVIYRTWDWYSNRHRWRAMAAAYQLALECDGDHMRLKERQRACIATDLWAGCLPAERNIKWFPLNNLCEIEQAFGVELRQAHLVVLDPCRP
jgi:hypothetical protein